MSQAVGGWKKDSDYGWSHQSGWTIGRYVVSGQSRFLLWQGTAPRGRFGSLEEAMNRHIELTTAAVT